MGDALRNLIYLHIPMPYWWALGPFLAWRIGLRIYRLTARQTFSLAQASARAVSLGALILVVGAVAFAERTAFYAICAGLALGALIGAVGLKHTEMRIRPGAASIRPDLVSGVVLSSLLLGRIIWRLAAGAAEDPTGWNLAEFVRNPSTMLLFGLFSAHYFVYSLGIVRAVRRRRAEPG